MAERPTLTFDDIVGAPDEKPGRPTLSYGDITNPPPMEEPPQGPSQTNFDWADIGKSAGAQGALGIVADVPGAIGSLGQLWDAGSEKAFKYGVLKPLELMGAIPEGGSDQIIESAKQIGLSPAEAKGKVNTIFGIPVATSSGMEDIAKTVAPPLGYESKTPEGEVAGKLARATTGMAAGPVEGMVGRATSGLAGSAIGQQVAEANLENQFTTPEYAPYLEAATTMLGTGLASAGMSAGRQLARPTKVASEQLAQAMKRDLDANPALSPVFNSIMSGQVKGNVADIFSPNTETGRLMSLRAGQAGGEAANRDLAEYNAARTRGATGAPRSELYDAARENVLGFVQNNIGQHDAASLESAIQQSNRQTRDILYTDIPKKNPKANNLGVNELGSSVINDPNVQEAIKTINGLTIDPQWNVVKPSFSPAVPPRPIKGPTGQPLLDASGNPIMTSGTPGSMTPGNFGYWDMVQRQMRDTMDKARSDTAGIATVNSIDYSRKKLMSALENQIPEYAPTRAMAGELFGQDSAPAAGSELYKSGSRLSGMDLNNTLKDFSQLSDTSKSYARTGWLNELSKDLNTPNGVRAVANRFATDGNFQKVAKTILGQTDFEALRGITISNDVVANATPVIAQQVPGLVSKMAHSKTLIGGAGTALVASGADALVNAAVFGQFTPAIAGTAAAIAGTSAAKQVYQNARDLQLARKTVGLMLSDSIPDKVRLSRMMDKDPKVAGMISKINTTLQGKRLLDQPQPTDTRVGRASGGRITAEGRGDALVRSAEAAKNRINQTTEPLLAAHDDHIAKALEIAQENI